MLSPYPFQSTLQKTSWSAGKHKMWRKLSNLPAANLAIVEIVLALKSHSIQRYPGKRNWWLLSTSMEWSTGWFRKNVSKMAKNGLKRLKRLKMIKIDLSEQNNSKLHVLNVLTQKRLKIGFFDQKMTSNDLILPQNTTF